MKPTNPKTTISPSNPIMTAISNPTGTAIYPYFQKSKEKPPDPMITIKLSSYFFYTSTAKPRALIKIAI